MEITRTSQWSGITRTIDLNITQKQLDRYNAGVKVQNAFPHLNADEREFILTGMTQSEWDEMAGPEEE